MLILNLAYPDRSDISFKVSKFPDGQQDIILTPFDTSDSPLRLEEEILISHPVMIKSRFNSFQDLELIICATKALRRLQVTDIHLYIPYLLGARSDRQFVKGGTSYLVDVIAPIINSLNFKSVQLLDCHSDVGVALLYNSINVPNVKLLQWALPKIDNTFDAQSKVAIVSPDGGALKKIYDTVSGAKLNCDIILSAKHRDVLSGKLNGFDVPLQEHQLEKTLVWVDDICDGGGTFIGEAIKANENGHKGKKYLVVTHGILSAGLENLSKYFDGIFCTNSVKDISNTEFDGVNTKTYPNFINQLNIF